MWACKDKSGTYLVAVSCPVRVTSHWKAADNNYMVINSKYGESLFPSLKWEDDPIEIQFGFY